MRKPHRLFPSRRNLFAVVAIFLGTLPILISESCLRQTDIHRKHDLFVPVGNTGEYLIMNPNFANRYFSGFTPSVALNPFLREKSENVYRVFVLGESSVAGYPYSFGYGFPQALELMLKKSMPEKRVEVINLGLTAVSSYTIWDINRRLDAYQPDAIVIYTGHNEYYGAMGVGSSQSSVNLSPRLNRWILRAHDSGIYSWVKAMFNHEISSSPIRTTTMENMIRDAGIERYGDIYEAGVRQFESNLKRITRYNTANKIPTYIASITSNLADQTPLGENHMALEAFEKGRELAQNGQIDEARTLFLEAKEFDEIRFRAPEAINDVIRQHAQADVVYYVDIASLAIEWSTSGIEDDSFFIDHLHPNFESYKRIAEEFAKIMQPEATTSVVLPEFHLDQFEDLLALTNIDLLKSGYPFNKTTSANYEQRFEEIMLDLLLNQNTTEARNVVSLFRNEKSIFTIYANLMEENQTSLLQGKILWNPLRRQLIWDAVQHANPERLNLKEFETILLLGANRIDHVDFYNVLGALYLMEDQIHSAYAFLSIVSERDPNNATMLYNFARYYVITDELAKAQQFFERYQRLTSNP